MLSNNQIATLVPDCKCLKITFYLNLVKEMKEREMKSEKTVSKIDRVYLLIKVFLVFTIG